MLRLLLMAGTLLLGLGQAGSAADIKARTKYYDISGDTGMKLLLQMDRKGPKHGFLARAIAQTQYSISTDADFAYADGACRSSRPRIGLEITYIFPRVASPLPAALQRRWTRFYAGVETHERNHGRIAGEMARAAERAMGGVTVPGDRFCREARREAKRRVNAVIARYEKRQFGFDAVEHRDGGKVDRLILGLIGRRT